MRRMKRAAGWVVLALAIAGAGAGLESRAAVAQLTGSDRTDFVQASLSSCTSSMQQAAPSISADAVKSYCTCMANKAADMTTPADLQYVAQHGTGSDDYTNRIKALAPGCLAAAGLGK
jgi:hypothetical protein